jgi:hypothetical protein
VQGALLHTSLAAAAAAAATVSRTLLSYLSLRMC